MPFSGGSQLGGSGVGGIEAGFGDPVWSLKPLLWAYGPRSQPPRAPPKAGLVGRRFWVRMPKGSASEPEADRQNLPRPPTPPPPIWHSPEFDVHKSVGDQRDASHSSASCVVALGTMVAVLVVLLIMKRAW